MITFALQIHKLNFYKVVQIPFSCVRIRNIGGINEMNILFTILITFFAGMGAGLGTGFAGMSAAAVISPMLISFLNVEPYTAVVIALSSDVRASAGSA